MRTLLVLLLTLGAAACTKEKPAVRGTCDEVGEAVVRFWAAEAKKETTDKGKQTATRMGAMTSVRLVNHCRQDSWSADAIACAKTGEFARCEEKLSADQMAKLRADAEPIQPKL